MDEMIFQRAGSVTCDFEGIKTKIEAYAKQYDGVIFTEDTKADAKRTVAEIRKSKKDYLDRIKEAKEKYMTPWNEFYDKAIAIADLFDKPVIQINEQIEAFEEQRRKDKIDKCKAIFAEMVPEEEILAYLPFAKVYNVKWENATYTDKAVKDDIMTAKLNVKTALDTIKSFKSDVEEQALDEFKRSLNMTEAIKIITKYEDNKRTALKKYLASEKEEIKEKVKEEVRQEAKEEVINQFVPTDTEEEERPYTYIVFLTPDAKEKLETFMNSVGIEFLARRDKQ